LSGNAADRESGEENREQELFHGRIVAEEAADSTQIKVRREAVDDQCLPDSCGGRGVKLRKRKIP
jgi:hypothetical protein